MRHGIDFKILMIGIVLVFGIVSPSLFKGGTAHASTNCDEMGCGGCADCGPISDGCDAGCDSTCGHHRQPRQLCWTASIDALFLDRDAADNLGGEGLVSRNGGGVLLDNDGLDPSSNAGYRLSLFMHQSDCLKYEVSYLSSDWDVARSVVGNNDLNAIAGTVDYTRADRMNFRYDSEIQSLEINQWLNVTHGFSWLMGFDILRWMRILI